MVFNRLHSLIATEKLVLCIWITGWHRDVEDLPNPSQEEWLSLSPEIFSDACQSFKCRPGIVSRSRKRTEYTPANINRTREQIREIVFYSKDGDPIKESTLKCYLSQRKKHFHNSTPYSKLCNARKNYNLNLYKPGYLFYHLYEWSFLYFIRDPGFMTGATAIESSLWRPNATSVREVG